MSMNLFRLAGDMAHVLSILVLLLRLRVTKNAVGISVKTQELYLVVFVARYMDLFTTYYSLYNTVMKVLYISTTSYIIYMIHCEEPFKSTYDKAHDSFLHWKFALAPCAVLGVLTNLIQGFDLLEVGSCLTNTLCYVYLFLVIDVLGFLHLSGSVSHCPTVVPLTTISRSGKLNWPLCLLVRNLPCFIHH
jgi:hypothetical protein